MTMDLNAHDEVRQALELKAKSLRRRIHAITRDLTQADGALSADWQEQAQEVENDEVLAAIDDSSRHELAMIDAALARIDEGKYGICTDCGATIAPARLKALPFATLCITCAREHEEDARQAHH